MCGKTLIAALLASAAITSGMPAKADNIRIEGAGGAPGIIQLDVEAQGSGAETSLVLRPRVDPEMEADLKARRWQDFEKDVQLAIRTDPALVPSARVFEMIEAIGMVDEAGIAIASGFAINVEHDFVLGSSVGNVQITNVAQGSDGLIITALVRDRDGKIIDPPEGSLAIYRTGGEKLCYSEEIVRTKELVRSDVLAPTASASIPMTFGILMDRSGSMEGHMAEMRRAAQGFIEALPDNAGCFVGAFSEGEASFEPGEGFGYHRCQSVNFPMHGLRPSGGTDLFGPLGDLYFWMNESVVRGTQRAVIIITDGQANQNLGEGPAVLAAKGEVVTFVYYLGGKEERFLQSLADSYLAHEGDLKEELQRFFSVVSEVYTSQIVLRQTACPAEAGLTQ